MELSLRRMLKVDGLENAHERILTRQTLKRGVGYFRETNSSKTFLRGMLSFPENAISQCL